MAGLLNSSINLLKSEDEARPGKVDWEDTGLKYNM